MSQTPEYMRAYRARRRAQGRPVPSGGRRDRRKAISDPEDYSNPTSDVRLGP